MTKSEPQDKPDVRTLLDELEGGIEALRHAYDKYFSGVDRVAPTKQHDRVKRQLRGLERMHITSTALRFRLQGLRARVVTYSHYWNRILDQIERGVYRRDVLRAARRASASRAEEGDEARAGESSERTRPEAPRLDEDNLKKVFRDLVQAKKAAGESLEGLTYAALVRKLSREAPKLRERHGCENVRFEVATVGGKVRLRARSD